MWRVLRGNLRLSYKQNFLAALAAAVVTMLFSTITLPNTLGWPNALALAVLHFAGAFLFLEFLWLPLTWCRKLFRGRRYEILGMGTLALMLLTLLCLLFPGNLLHFLFQEVTRQHEWQVEFVVIIIHAAFAFAFLLSLRHVGFFSRGVRSAGSRGTSAAPVRTKPFSNGLSFIFGLYFVLIFEWWMVNLHHTFALQQPFVIVPPAAKMEELLKPNPRNFLNLPRLFQPYDALFDLAGDSSTVSAGAAPQLAHAPARPTVSGAAGVAVMLLPVISVTLSGTFLLFIGGIVPLRLMSNILLAVPDREALYARRMRHTLVYTTQFFRAIIAQNPLFSISSLIVIIFLIIVPLLIRVGGNHRLLSGLIGPDQILFIFTLLAAWLSPLIYAGVYVDRTFGAYFNTKLANMILSMRDHLVVLGYGDLGQRVVRRELAKLLHRDPPQVRWWQRGWRSEHAAQAARRRSGNFMQRAWLELAISPELNIEHICNSVIVVDRNSENFVFAATSEVLGSYGVVSAWQKLTRYDRNRQFAPETSSKTRRERLPQPRILVPVIQGDATEPFTMARVNLERARFLISMVSQEKRVRDIFAHATECGLRAIICVSRSDQINNLTYKASRYPITLVYPKQHSGLALGQRLLAAVLKIRPQLAHDREYPHILVIGLNKSNHFMLETLWHSWPLPDDRRKAEIFTDMLRFVVTDEPPRSATVAPRAAEAAAPETTAATRPAPPSAVFNHWWHSSYITGFRHFAPATAPRPLSLEIPTCVMRMDEGGVLERCCNEVRPEIIVINDDDQSKSSMLLIRCVNTLERLKYERKDFRFPLILLSAAYGSEADKRDVGDAFRYYDALTHLYRDAPGAEHPRQAYYRREPPRRLVGDSVHDGLADAEEIISGVRDNWLLAEEHLMRTGSGAASSREVFELNTCLPNRSGALAELVARLAGLEFSCDAPATLQAYFTRPGLAQTSILRPSFQYLRQIRLETPGRGFCLSGYADLQENDFGDLPAEEHLSNAPLAVRVYAKNDSTLQQELPSPSLNRLMELVSRVPRVRVDAKTFIEVMQGPADASARDDYCPGMAICPIASFQHYIVASNTKKLAAWRANAQSEELDEVQNYSCCHPKQMAPRLVQDSFPRYARIFCCCQVPRNDPGMVAVVLNLLNFRRFERLHQREQRRMNLKDDWIVNLEYFKDTACQNRRFALNRLFGVRRRTSELLRTLGWSLEEYEESFTRILPINLIQIMPVGGAEVAWRWFDYGVALLRFMQNIGAPDREFKLQWWDQQGQCHTTTEIAASANYPIAIQINNVLLDLERQNQHCEFCNTADRDLRHGCAVRRPWMEDDR